MKAGRIGWVGVAALLWGCGVSSTSSVPERHDTETPPEIREFAQLPVEPGQPGGIVVDGNTVYVSTFGFVVRPADGFDNIYSYRLDTGTLLEDRPNPARIPRRFQVCIMGISGMAADGQGRLYLVDMNSRIVRLDPRTGATEDYATFPTGVAGPLPTMPLDIAFDPDGYAYVSDIGGAPIVWRIPPGGGQAEVWFTDTRFAGVWSQGGNGIRIDPTGRYIYLGVFTSAQNQGRGSIYRFPLENPTANQVELFHQYSNNVEAPPLGDGPLGFAFGASGKLYVAMPGSASVSVLKPDGTEERRIVLPAQAQFLALTERGSLLVTAWNFPNGPWPVYEVHVDDVPAGLHYPQID